MQENNRIKAEQILFNEFYCITKILQLLTDMRKAYGQLKFHMYDADVNHLENKETKLTDKYGKNGVRLLNIILLLARKNKKQPILSGFVAQLAGKIVMREAHKILDMRSACDHFIGYFNNKKCGYHEENILSFLTGGLKFLETDIDKKD